MFIKITKENTNKPVPYEKHIKELARMAKLANVATQIVRKLQRANMKGIYNSPEIEEISKLLKLKNYVEQPDGSKGYYNLEDALSESKGSVVWDNALELWITRGK